MPFTRLHSSLHHPLIRTWNTTVTSQVLTKESLIFPLFIHDQPDHLSPIPSLPGGHQYHIGLDRLVSHLQTYIDKGLCSVLLFPVITSSKTPDASNAFDDRNPVLGAISLLKSTFPDLCIVVDVCLCTFTSHGHCGVLNSEDDIDNDASIDIIARLAGLYALQGAHVVAPSDMMDGRIQAIKQELTRLHKESTCTVMSYSAKFASSWYGPFRDAACSGVKKGSGNRSGYQLPVGSRGLALRALQRDVMEGADIIMVKPGMLFLDIVRDARDRFIEYPLAIYQVSGEFAMMMAGAEKGVVDLKEAVLESFESMMRAGNVNNECDLF